MGVGIRFLDYIGQRFPPFPYFLLSIGFFLSGYFLSQPGAFRIHSTIMVGVMIVFLFFLRLRIFDELKDYEFDKKFHPERPVQRGIISLRELSQIAILCMVAEFLLALYAGIWVFFTYVFCLAFSSLMLAEFFIGKFLRRNILLYAIPHVLVMPILGAFCFLFYPLSTGSSIQFGVLALFMSLCYFMGLLFEITRKMFSEGEKVNFPTFTSFFGNIQAWLIVALLSTTSSFFLFVLLGGKFIGWLSFVIPISLFGLALLKPVAIVFLENEKAELIGRINLAVLFTIIIAGSLIL